MVHGSNVVGHQPESRMPISYIAALVGAALLLLQWRAFGDARRPFVEVMTSKHLSSSSNSSSLAAWLGALNTNDYPAVIVTALYDIGRGARGRDMDTYLEWFGRMLRIASPMVAFVGDQKVMDFIRQERSGLPTLVALRPFEDVEYAKLVPWVESVLKSEQWQSCITDKDRLEWTLPSYVPLVWSKLSLTSEVARSDPHAAARYYVWVDAGAGRWTTAAEGSPWPNITKLKQLYDPAGDKLVLQHAGADTPIDGDLRRFFCGDGRGILAGVILGTAPIWHRLARKFHDFVYEELVPTDMLASEQMIFKVWIQENSSQFAIVPQKCPDSGCKSPDSPLQVIEWLA